MSFTGGHYTTSSAVLLLVLLTGVLFLLMFALAPPAKAERPDPLAFDIGESTLLVTPSILPPFDFNSRLLTLRNSGSAYWAYLDSTQYRTDWWSVEIVPEDLEEGVFAWSSRIDLLFVTAEGDSIPIVDFVLSTGCGERDLTRCKRVDVMRGVVMHYLTLVVPQKNPRIQGYLGTRRGTVRPESLVGFDLEVKR